MLNHNIKGITLLNTKIECLQMTVSTLDAKRCTLDFLYICRECSTNHPLFEKTKPILCVFRLKTMICEKTNPIQTQFSTLMGARPSLSSLKDKNNDVIIRRITMKNGLLRVIK